MLKYINIIIFLLVLSIGYILHIKGFQNYFIINDDVMHHLYWMQQFQDPEIFQNDLLTEYSKSIQPWGVICLYKLLSYFFNPIWSSKFVTLVLYAIASLYIFKIGFLITKDNFVSFIGLLVFALGDYSLGGMSGGHARAFAYPLIVGFLYYIIKKEHLKVGFIICLQSLFYPTVFVLSLLASLGILVWDQKKKSAQHGNMHPFLILVFAGFVGGGLLISKQVFFQDPNIGRFVSGVEMKADPAFYKGGRLPILPIVPLWEKTEEFLRNRSPFYYAINKINKYNKHNYNIYLTGSEITYISYIILFILIGLTIFGHLRSDIFFPIEIIIICSSGMLLYKVAEIFIPKFFWPERYLRYSVFIVSIYIFITGLNQAFKLIKLDNIKYKNIIIISTKIFLIMLIVTGTAVGEKNNGLKDMSYLMNFYHFIGKLPKNAIIAGHPRLVDGVPTFSKRVVFINDELSQPYFSTYWKTIKERTYAFFQAYYAENTKEIYDFCKKNHIDYLVVNTHDFKKLKTKDEFYFEPFESEIRRNVIGRTNFALLGITSKEKLFQMETIFVIHRDSLL